MTDHWANIEEKGTLFGIKVLLAIYSLFGRIPFLVILFPVVIYYYCCNARARNASIEFLSNVHRQSKTRSKQSIYWISYLHFLNFARGLLDKLIAWMGAIDYQHIDFQDKKIFSASIKNRQDSLQAYASILVRYVMSYPLQWYNFFPFWIEGSK